MELLGARMAVRLDDEQLLVALAPGVYAPERTQTLLKSIGNLCRLQLGVPLGEPEQTVLSGWPALAWRMPPGAESGVARISRTVQGLALLVEQGRDPFAALGQVGLLDEEELDRLLAAPGEPAVGPSAAPPVPGTGPQVAGPAADALPIVPPAAPAAPTGPAREGQEPAREESPAPAAVRPPPSPRSPSSPFSREDDLRRARALGLPSPPVWPEHLLRAEAAAPAARPASGERSAVLEDLRRPAEPTPPPPETGVLADWPVEPAPEPADLAADTPVDLVLVSAGPFPTKLRRVLSILLSVDYPKAGDLVAHPPTVLLRGARAAVARRYAQVLQQAGGRCRIDRSTR